MFTRNYKVFEISNKLNFTLKWANTETSMQDYARYNLVSSLKDVDGSTDYVSVDETVFTGAYKLVRWDNNALPTSTLNNDSYLLFGSGTATLTPNDYKMEDAFGADTLQYVSQSSSASINDETEKYQLVLTNTLRNKTGSDITIKEVGYIKGIYSLVNGEGAKVNNAHFLFWREVLAEPVTIAAGMTTTITVVLEL